MDRPSYYNKIMKAKPFRIAGKDGLAREVIEFATPRPRVVRYLTEESFRTIVSVVANPHHLLLLWLAWDIGENVDSLLKLTKSDFFPQANVYTGEREYVVNLPSAKLKRSRLSRSEVTLYPETARYCDLVLKSLDHAAPLFDFENRAAAKTLQRAVARSGATTMPNGDPVRWKDFRSGMACHLLRAGWSRDEVNARLGHTPHSSALDAYINFLAIDRARAKSRLQTRSAGANPPAMIRPSIEVGTEPPTIRSSAHDDVRLLRDELAALRKQVSLLSQTPPQP